MAEATTTNLEELNMDDLDEVSGGFGLGRTPQRTEDPTNGIEQVVDGLGEALTEGLENIGQGVSGFLGGLGNTVARSIKHK